MSKTLLRRNCSFANSGTNIAPAAEPSVTEPPHPVEMPAKQSTEQAPEQPDVPAAPDFRSSRRAGDSGLGRPHRSAPPVPAHLHLQPVRSEEAEKLHEIDDKIWSSSFAMPKSISNFIKYALLFFVSVVALFVISQTASFLADVRELSLYEQIALSLPLALFGFILLWITVKILLLLKRLHVSPQIRIKTLQELEDRQEMRNLCLQGKILAREKLCRFLNFYESDCADELQKLNVSAEKINELKQQCQMLNEAGENLKSTTVDWIHDVKNTFQSQLDDFAKERIMKYSVNAGIMAGISPIPLIDRLIVLTNSVAMLKELLQIYGLRPAWDKSLVLISQVICNTYLAGVIDNAVDFGSEKVIESLEGITETIPELALKFAGKAAGAATQGYMVYRLGKTAQRLLQPIR